MIIKKKPLLIAGVLIGILVIGLIIRGGKPTTPVATTQTGVVERGTLVVSLASSGQISNANSASIATKATGVVKKIVASNGKVVKTGDPILILDLDQESTQAYQQALSSYRSAQNALKSAESNTYSLQSKLFAANQKYINDAAARNLSTSDPTYIQEYADWLAAEANYKNQDGALTQARAAIQSALNALNQVSPTVTAPIPGTVNGLSAQVGSVIAAQTGSSTTTSQKIATIQTSALPTVTLNLTEIDAPKVKVGNKATLTLDAFAGKTFTGTVVSIDTVGSVSSGVTTYPTVIKLDTAIDGVFANMSVQANIITATKDNTLIVPTTAITTSNGEKTVRVMKNGKSETVTVETGLTNGSETEITSGLSEGDTIVTSVQTVSTTRSSTQTQSPFGGLTGGARTGGAARSATFIRAN